MSPLLVVFFQFSPFPSAQSRPHLLPTLSTERTTTTSRGESAAARIAPPLPADELPSQKERRERRKVEMGVPEQEEGECAPFVKRRKSAVATDVSMELDFLDCPICFHPLCPPIYQCAVGHVVCSSCCAKLSDKCHCCSLATGYNRCHIIEHIVDSTKVPCCYDMFGCTEKITYYEKENHEKVCPQAPCFCPETGCDFTGSIAMLVNHFSSVHKWHFAKISYNKAFRIRIAQGSTALQSEDGQLFLVNMVLEPLGGLISVFCIQPHITGSNFKCKLQLSGPEMNFSQVTQFQTKSTKLFDGLPKDCFLFFVPKMLLRDSGTNVTTMVTMTLIPLSP